MFCKLQNLNTCKRKDLQKSAVQFICKFTWYQSNRDSAFLYLFVLEIPCLLLDQAILDALDDQNVLVDLLLLWVLNCNQEKILQRHMSVVTLDFNNW